MGFEMHTRSLFSRYAVAASMATLLSFSAPTYASTVLNWTGGTLIANGHPQTVGWDFTANQAITVSALDWYDPTDTNSYQHTVDIWTSTGTLVGTACVGSGCTNSSWSASYWSTAVSLSLAAGSYVIGGQANTGEPWQYGWSTSTTDPAITYGIGVYNYPTASTTFPTTAFTTGIVGPSFEIAATPLPSTWLMLLSGFVGLGFFAYRGTKNRSAALAA